MKSITYRVILDGSNFYISGHSISISEQGQIVIYDKNIPGNMMKAILPKGAFVLIEDSQPKTANREDDFPE